MSCCELMYIDHLGCDYKGVECKLVGVDQQHLGGT